MSQDNGKLIINTSNILIDSHGNIQFNDKIVMNKNNLYLSNDISLPDNAIHISGSDMIITLSNNNYHIHKYSIETDNLLKYISGHYGLSGEVYNQLDNMLYTTISANIFLDDEKTELNKKKTSLTHLIKDLSENYTTKSFYAGFGTTLKKILINPDKIDYISISHTLYDISKFVSSSANVFSSFKFLNKTISGLEYDTFSVSKVYAWGLTSHSGYTFDNRFQKIQSTMGQGTGTMTLEKQVNVLFNITTSGTYWLSEIPDVSASLISLLTDISNNYTVSSDFFRENQKIRNTIFSESDSNPSLKSRILDISKNIRDISQYIMLSGELFNNYIDKFNDTIYLKGINSLSGKILTLSSFLFSISGWSRKKSDYSENDYLYTNTNIGLGTSTISGKLHISGMNVYISNNLKIYDNTLTISNYKSLYWNSGLIINNTNIIKEIYNKITDKNEVVLGINTLTPSGKLHISGNSILITNNNTTINVENSLDTLIRDISNINDTYISKKDFNNELYKLRNHNNNTGLFYDLSSIVYVSSNYLFDLTVSGNEVTPIISISETIYDISQTYTVSSDVFQNVSNLNNIIGRTHIFHRLGSTEYDGPDITDYNSYISNYLYPKITFNGGKQLWTVPQTGNYYIEAWGAKGGDSTKLGGKGVKIYIPSYKFNVGESVYILVGQKGQSTSNKGSGGGGGTFVIKSDNTRIIIAGGGGGAGTHYNGGNALLINNGGDGSNQNNNEGQGGSDTSSAEDGYNGGAGGGGFLQDGNDGTDANKGKNIKDSTGEGGQGGQGGNGGFGGGAEGASKSGGGGGGNSGGGGGGRRDDKGGGGGGGGSWGVSGFLGYNDGHGKVIISFLSNSGTGIYNTINNMIYTISNNIAISGEVWKNIYDLDSLINKGSSSLSGIVYHVSNKYTVSSNNLFNTVKDLENVISDGMESISGRLYTISSTYALSGEVYTSINNFYKITISGNNSFNNKLYDGLTSISGVIYSISRNYSSSGRLFGFIDDIYKKSVSGNNENPDLEIKIHGDSNNNIGLSGRLYDVSNSYATSGLLWHHVNYLYKINVSNQNSLYNLVYSDKSEQKSLSGFITDISKYALFRSVVNENYEKILDKGLFISGDYNNSQKETGGLLITGDNACLQIGTFKKNISGVLHISGIDSGEEVILQANVEYFSDNKSIRDLSNLLFKNGYSISNDIISYTHTDFNFKEIYNHRVVKYRRDGFVDISSSLSSVSCFTIPIFQNSNEDTFLKDITICNRTNYNQYFDLNFDKISQIESGKTCTFLVTNDGYIYSTGTNSSAGTLLGQDNTSIFKRCTDTNNKFQCKVKQVSCGDEHTMLVTNDGYVYATGNSLVYRTGNNDETHLTEFTQCFDNNFQGNVKQVSCGYQSSLLVTNNNKLYVTGTNVNIGTHPYDKHFFTEISSINKYIKQVSCSYGHSLLVTADNNIYATGNRAEGQTSLPTKNFWVLAEPKTIIQGKVRSVETSNFEDDGYSFLITNDNKLYATGNNSNGQLGMGTTQNISTFSYVSGGNIEIFQGNVRQVSAGSEHSLLVTDDYYVYATGLNDNGQLGMGNIGENLNVFSYVSGGNVEDFQGNVKQVSAGNTHSSLLTNDGKLYITGNNNNKLGMGDNTPSIFNSFHYVSGGNVQYDFYLNKFTNTDSIITLKKDDIYKINTFYDMTPTNNFNTILLRPISGTKIDTKHTLDIYSTKEVYVSGYYV